MSVRRAIAIAPVAIYPVALVFIMARSLLAGDLRELLVSPFSAMMIMVVGYPLAITMGWLLLRISPSLLNATYGLALVVGVVSAELVFWLIVHPFWEREFSDMFCVALVAACAIATVCNFLRLKQKNVSR